MLTTVLGRNSGEELQTYIYVSVDGEWGEWGNWSACQKTCGHSTRIRTRNCDNPSPNAGGLDCQGQSLEFQNCSRVVCPGAYKYNVHVQYSQPYT